MNEEKRDFLDGFFEKILIIFTILYLASYPICFVICVYFLFKVVGWPVIAICLLLIILFRKEIVNSINSLKQASEKRHFEKERECAESAYKTSLALKFENAPKSLTEAQIDKLNNFIKDIDFIATQNYVYAQMPPMLTKEQLYAMFFIHKEDFALNATTLNGKEVVMEFEIVKNKPKLLNETSLKAFAPEEVPFVQKKHKCNNRIKKQRKLRKLKAEAKKNGCIVKNGKQYQKPNYTFLANEWIVQNIGLINKIITDNYDKHPTKIEGFLLADVLPKEKETWKHIGTQLITNDDIDSFVLMKNGLQIVINK